MSKVEEKITTIRNEVDAIVNLNQSGFKQSEYINRRVTINVLVLDTLLGFDSKPGKNSDEIQICANQPMPTGSEVAQVSSLMQKLRDIESHIRLLSETPTLAASVGMDVDGADKVPATTPPAPTNPDPGTVQEYKLTNRGALIAPEKISFKTVKEAFYGGGGAAASGMFIGPEEVAVIAAVGEKLRKKRDTRRAIIVGSIAVAVIAGAVTWAVIESKKQDEKIYDENYDEDIDNNDTPVVSVEDGIPELSGNSMDGFRMCY